MCSRNLGCIFSLLCWASYVAAQCQSNLYDQCQVNLSKALYPENLSIFGAYEGQLFTVGNVVMLVARFPDSTCNLPDLSELSNECIPYLTVTLRYSGGTCYDVPSVSVKKLDREWGFSFADDPNLETNTGEYLHWAFPLYVVSGMSASRFIISGLTIPSACNSPRGNFENSNQIRNGLTIYPTIRIDTTTADIVSIHTGKSAGRYTVGTIIILVVEFDKDVVLSGLPDQYSQTYISSNGPKKIPYGVPYLAMNSNALVPLLGYDSARSRRKIAFFYEVTSFTPSPPCPHFNLLIFQLHYRSDPVKRRPLESSSTCSRAQPSSSTEGPSSPRGRASTSICRPCLFPLAKVYFM